jgi:hypothetical protein
MPCNGPYATINYFWRYELYEDVVPGANKAGFKRIGNCPCYEGNICASQNPAYYQNYSYNQHSTACCSPCTTPVYAVDENEQLIYPLTYDNLHDSANPSILPDGSVVPFERNFMKFFQTWTVQPVFHWSEAEAGTKRNHAKNLTTAPPDMGLDVTWEIEVKGKDKAFIHLIKRIAN